MKNITEEQSSKLNRVILTLIFITHYKIKSFIKRSSLNTLKKALVRNEYCLYRNNIFHQYWLIGNNSNEVPIFISYGVYIRHNAMKRPNSKNNYLHWKKYECNTEIYVNIDAILKNINIAMLSWLVACAMVIF